MRRTNPGRIYNPSQRWTDRYPWTAFNDGVDRNRATSSTFTRQTAEIFLHKPVIIEKVLWDIRNNGTYTCQFVTAIDGTTVYRMVSQSQVVTAGADVAFVPSAPFLLMPGQYFLQLALDSGSATFDDSNASTYYTSAIMSHIRMAYATTIYQFTYTAPFRLVGVVGDPLIKGVI